MDMSRVRGRFAPSPSGRMHLGNVFCALIAWLCAKATGGENVLRIEDLDTARCRPEYIDVLLDDLRFLGLSYDEGEGVTVGDGSYRQSRRTALYEEAFSKLQQAGVIYPCFCRRDELHVPNAPHASDGRILYTGTCRRLTTEQIAAQTRAPSYRIQASSASYAFEDAVYGKQSICVQEEWGDFVVRRSDGLFAYQLAVVVDDAAMGITQVVRGRDLLTSVAPQCQLYEQLGLNAPQFCHIPLLVAPDGRRLSKRDRDLEMGVLRQRYTSAEPLIGKLLFLAGILPFDEPICVSDAVGEFSLQKLCKEDIVIDYRDFIE